jgi:hypothetical protein
MTKTLDTMPPAFWYKQAISRTNFTLQAFGLAEGVVSPRAPNSSFKSLTLSTLHHVCTSDGSTCSTSDSCLYMMEYGGTRVWIEETDLLSARELDEEIWIRITM